MRDVSGVKSSIVKNEGEGTRTATPPSLQRMQRRRGAADLGYGRLCTGCGNAVVLMRSTRSHKYGRLPAAPPRRALGFHHVGVLNVDRVLVPA